MTGFEELFNRFSSIVDVALVRASSPIPLSREMTLLLCLVIFDGYELFPAHEPNRLARTRLPDGRKDP